MAPTLTIGMPVYNGAQFIEQALAALLGQTYRNFVVFVSDNVSTDGAWEILQKWAERDDRIVLHRQESNIGALANFRYVLDHAQSEYFMWHAHDDWLEPNYLEELIDIITREPRCTLACGTIQRVMPDGTPTRNGLRLFPDLAGRSRLGRVKKLLWFAQGPWLYGLFRAEDLRRAQAIQEEFGYAWAGDRLTLLQFILNDRIRGTSRTVLYSIKTPFSRQTYRPKTLAKQLRFFGRFLRFHFRVFRASELSRTEKLRCWPWLVIHAIRTKGMLTFKQLIRRPVTRFVKKLVAA